MIGRARKDRAVGAGTTGTAVNRKTHSGRWSTPLAILFGLLFLLGAIELGLMADIVHWANKRFSSVIPHWVKQRAVYALIAAVWTVLASLLYFLLARLFRGFKWTHAVALATITFLMWIIAASLLEKAFTHTPSGISCNSIFGSSKCRELKAARALAWILTALSLLSIPAAWYFGRKAAHHERDTPLTTTTREADHTGVGHHTGTTGTTAHGVNTTPAGVHHGHGTTAV